MHRGELFGIAPIARRICLEGATFSQLGRDGLVIADVHFSDVGALPAQLST